MTSIRMEGYSLFWVIDKIGIFVQHYFPGKEVPIWTWTFALLGLVDWMRYLTTVRRGNSFEKSHYVGTDTLINPVLCVEPTSLERNQCENDTDVVNTEILLQIFGIWFFWILITSAVHFLCLSLTLNLKMTKYQDFVNVKFAEIEANMATIACIEKLHDTIKL